jgi:hypothetical protein
MGEIPIPGEIPEAAADPAVSNIAQCGMPSVPAVKDNPLHC